MKIGIDESGDVGRKFWRGSSRHFILTAIIVPDSDFCGPICQSIDEYRRTHNEGRELHFAHNSHQQHVDFLSYMQDKDYVFASVVIDKKKLLIRKPIVFKSKMSFLSFAFDQLFKELKPWLDNPKVVIDSNGSKHFNRSLARHLVHVYGSRHKGDIHSIQKVISVDSSSEPLVQMADYVCGAIHHHIDGRHPTSNTYELYVKNKGKIFFV